MQSVGLFYRLIFHFLYIYPKYDLSENVACSPAPVSTTTWLFCDSNLATESGTRDTLVSLCIISLGIAIFIRL